jgi:hypothetical protein
MKKPLAIILPIFFLLSVFIQSAQADEKLVRCVRLWTGPDNISHFEEGVIALDLHNNNGDILSPKWAAKTVSFQKTNAGGFLGWHGAPTRQLVITLSGTLDFVNRLNEHFMIYPGDVLLAEDIAGTGHSWKLVGSDPWLRAYIVLEPDAVVPFKAN